MNLNLLIKLVKLANNNPNEHEANSAARRACKLIAEGEYKFVGEVAKAKPAEPKVYKAPTTPKNNNMWNDYFEGFDYNPWSGFNKANSKEAQNERERREASETNKKRREYNPNPYDIPYVNYYGGSQANPAIRRICTRCGLDVETCSIQTPFICYICILNKIKV